MMTESEQKIMNALRELYKQNAEILKYLHDTLGTTTHIDPQPTELGAKPWDKWKKQEPTEDEDFKL